jgi:peptidoglycan/xylan/chitin deacetylase (PgdA/CDA1 family)
MPKTKIINLMFHQVTDPEKFTAFLEYLVKHFPIVIPGEPLPHAKVVVSLSFDDAYSDFYHIVYPLLLKHQIKAILAVPVSYIDKDSYCTWQQLDEMAQSGLVAIASHSHTHANLNQSTHLHQEIVLSKQILEQKLNHKVNYFVYPYGRFTRKIHKMVCQHYDYGIRIGSALNQGWDLKNRHVYRINADPLWLNGKIIDEKLIQKLTFKYWVNRVRFK